MYSVDGMLSGLNGVLSKTKPGGDYLLGGGEGIITVGGGKFWPGIYVMIRLVRELGYTGAIEVWHRGCETVYLEEVAGYNVSFHCIDNLIATGAYWNAEPLDGTHGGWKAKLFALYHTCLDRVLFLDADAYLVEHPRELFKLLDGHPFNFWRDLAGQDRAVEWKNIWPVGDAGVLPVQGGQLIIDREGAFRLIAACHYMCQNAGYYFQHLYGDQDTWRVGLAAGACSYQCLGPANWMGTAFLCLHDRIGYVVHRCQGKLYIPENIDKGKVTYANPQYALPREVRVFDLFAECVNKKPVDPGYRFDAIYERKLWGGGSGSGSTIQEASPFITQVNALLEANSWRSVVDVGCGDGIVGSQLQCDNYIGVDCSTHMIRQCRLHHPKNQYIALDIYKDYGIIHAGDVLICKDVLHHWPTEWVENWLTGLSKTRKWKAVILCQDELQLHSEQDCYLGGYRALSPTMKPLNQFPLERVGTVLHKSLLLWRF